MIAAMDRPRAGAPATRLDQGDHCEDQAQEGQEVTGDVDDADEGG